MSTRSADQLPDKMTAVRIRTPGGPEVLETVEMPIPQPRADEVLLRVAAAGVNRPDILQRKGLYPVPEGASPLPGLEISGTIVTAPASSSFKPGDPVLALTNGGGYAQFAAVPVGQVLPLPKGYDLEEGAALPETLFTIEQTLVMRAGLKTGQSVLVHGGAGGIGGAALQRARLAGAQPILTTVSSPQKADYAMQMGATHTIDYNSEDFLERVREATGGKGVDIVLDMIGAPYLARNMKALATGGTLVSLAMLGGARGEIDLGVMLTRQLTLFGSTLRPRSKAEKAAIARHLLDHVWPALEDGRYGKPRITRYPLHAAAEAHAHMDSPHHIGKIVLITSNGEAPAGSVHA